jgi:hypothetical protein
VARRAGREGRKRPGRPDPAVLPQGVGAPVLVRRYASGLFLATSAAVILAATLQPTASEAQPAFELCVICGDRGTADAILNVVLFAPLGLGLGLLLGVRPLALVLAGVLSGLIETAQVLIPGRDPSLGDLLFNTLGAAVGLALVGFLPKALRLEGSSAVRAALGLAAVAAAIVLATGRAVQPSLPRATYYGQWTPDLRHLGRYDGHVLRAAVADTPIGPGRLDDGPRVRDLLIAGAPIEVEAVAGTAVNRLAPVLAVFDDGQEEIVLIGVDREDLVFRLRYRAHDAWLDRTDVRAFRALRDVQPGDTLRIRVERTHGRSCLTVDGRTACHSFGPASGWTLLYAMASLPHEVRRFFDLVWMALLWLPAGLVARTRRAAGGGLAVLIAGFAAVPALDPFLAHAAPWDWLAGGLGWAAGHGLRPALLWLVGPPRRAGP